MMIINDIADAVTEYYAQGYRFFGIRVDSANRSVGQYFAKSNDWEQGVGHPTSHKLSGTSAVKIPGDSFLSDDEMVEITRTMEYAQKMYRGNLYIIAGKFGEYGDDAGEIIIGNCRVYKDGKGRNIGGLCIYKITQ